MIEWTVANVIEWMPALNLYRYVEVFKKKQVDGKELITLDEEKLKVRAGSLPGFKKCLSKTAILKFLPIHI